MGQQALETVLPYLHRRDDNRQVVVLTCGISGAGKSTLSKDILSSLPNFTRLSIDKFIYETYGLFGIDYAESKYSGYQLEGLTHVKNELVRLLQETDTDIVLDLSFWNKKFRDDFKAIVERHGGRWVLAFLDASRELLAKRIAFRRAWRDALAADDNRRDGDSAFSIDDATFELYCSGFERPAGEGEIVVKML